MKPCIALITLSTLSPYLYDCAADDLQDSSMFNPVDSNTCLRGRDQLEAVKYVIASLMAGGSWTFTETIGYSFDIFISECLISE